MNERPRIAGWERYFWPAISAAAIVAAWQWAVEWSGSKVFPSPAEVLRGLVELARKRLLLRYIGASLGRVGMGYPAAAVLGIPIGLMLGWYKQAERMVNPLIQMARPISPIAWIPIAIVWFGVGNPAAVYLIFLAAFFPIVVAAINGVRNVPPIYRQAGCNLGLSTTQLLTRVIFPASLPHIIMGLRIAAGIAWLVVVAAEMIAVDSGLGYLVIDARNSGKRYDLVVAAMLLIGLIGLTLDTAFRQLETLKSVRWGFRCES